MRQAIQTKYLGPTDKRGSRVKAWAAAGSITLGWKNELNSDDNHYQAALTLQGKFDWSKYNSLIGGVLPNGEYCFVQQDKRK
jgi:hypothetical protein